MYCCFCYDFYDLENNLLLNPISEETLYSPHSIGKKEQQPNNQSWLTFKSTEYQPEAMWPVHILEQAQQRLAQQNNTCEQHIPSRASQPTPPTAEKVTQLNTNVSEILRKSDKYRRWEYD